MNFELLTAGFLSPPVLFFFLGLLAIFFRSDLEFPNPLPKFFSMYLLFAIGFKGGVELRMAGFNAQMGSALLAAMILATLAPFPIYFFTKKRFGAANAAGLAATYGSVSAVTFITASSMLQMLEVPFGGHMVAALALMESPAIIVGVGLFRLQSKQPDCDNHEQSQSWSTILHESFFNGSVFLLMGSLAIGLMTGHDGDVALKPFVSDIFKGMLCLFLLDLGIVSGRRLADLKRYGAVAIGFSIVVPLVQALAAIGISFVIGLSVGNAFLLTVLAASASYIAVPAALRHSIPDANPGLYVGMSLGLTFPFNILIGLPLYFTVIQYLWE